MISRLFRRSKQDATIDALYGMIVAQARSPAFYRDYDVPDTVTGRLEMIVLHLVLVLRRLKEEGGVVPPAGQALFDRFCRDIDDNFREMGVGDLAVPKKMRRMAEGFYGRAQAYEAALDGPDGLLENAVARNVLGVPEPEKGARRLAAYIRETTAQLDCWDAAALLPSGLVFPDPGAVGVPQS
jgi:cytochrome b pre-mRNA-processing protein 3